MLAWSVLKRYNKEYIMMGLKKWIQQNSRRKRLPKLSLWVLASIISLELGISLIIGYFIALFFAGRHTKAKGRIPSLIFRFKQYRIHLHHWLVFSNVIAVTLILHFFIVSPLLFYGLLGGVVAQGVLHYEDWHTIVQKIS